MVRAMAARFTQNLGLLGKTGSGEKLPLLQALGESNKPTFDRLKSPQRAKTLNYNIMVV